MDTARVTAGLIVLVMIFITGCEQEMKTADTFEPKIAIVPEPVSMTVGEGFFEIDSKTIIAAKGDASDLAKQLRRYLRPATGFKLKVKRKAKSTNSIVLVIDKSLAHLGDEGYDLNVTPKRVTVKAADQRGIFYGMMTIRQLLPAEIFGDSKVSGVKWQMPCVTVNDKPRFKWRGMHLDVARHYMPVEFLKKYIDLLAMHKMNVFHWHLTEDQGWRIEIKKYPKLSEISAWRKESIVGHYNDKPRKFDGVRHGGVYRQDEIREIVAYAKQRFVTVVPEIEMPGHSVAVLAAYPELSCTGGPFEVSTLWGIRKDVYCAGNEKTYEFLEDVMTEVLELFDSEFIHVGGDECPKDRWKECEKCQAKIAAEGLKDEHELQSYVIKRMEKFLSDRGRRLIGWDEILEGGLAEGATVMSWRGEKGGITAAKQGHDVVMATTTHTYLDYYQADPKNEPLAIGGLLKLEKVYSYDPVPASLTRQEAKHILGAQAQVWTEYIATPAKAEYMAFPRGIAISEIVWSPLAKKDYANFVGRLGVHLKRLDEMDVNYRPLD